MSTTINVTVGGNGLLDQSRQQMQANRFGKLERDQDAKTTAEAQQQSQEQAVTTYAKPATAKRVTQEPAANRNPLKIIKVQINNGPEFFTTGYPYTSANLGGMMVASGGPFNDGYLNGNQVINSYVRVTPVSSVKAKTAPFTIETWAKNTGGSGGLGILYRDLGMPVSASGSDIDSIRMVTEFRSERGMAMYVSFPSGYREAFAPRSLYNWSSWVHYAICRKGSSLYFFANGKLLSSDGSGALGTTDALEIKDAFYMNGLNSILQGQTVITLGKAKYTEEFSPPSERI